MTREFWTLKIDGLVKSRKSSIFVIAAAAAILSFQDVVDPGLRRGDGLGTFYEFIKIKSKYVKN